MNAQETPNQALVSVSKWLRELGKSTVTFYRWRKRGWIGEPVNIAGRAYLTQATIDEFYKRAAAGEFATTPRVPKRNGRLQ